jgi:hypothetical protein
MNNERFEKKYPMLRIILSASIIRAFVKRQNLKQTQVVLPIKRFASVLNFFSFPSPCLGTHLPGKLPGFP